MAEHIDRDHLEHLLSQSPRLRWEIGQPEIPAELGVLYQYGEPTFLFVTTENRETTRVYRLVEEPGGPAVADQECRGRGGKQLNVNLWSGHLVGGRLEY